MRCTAVGTSAQHAERLGYRRYWLAEHHNMPGIASAATAVAIGHVAAGTTTIRVGAGGVMLPNHAPLAIGGAVRHAGGVVSRADRSSGSAGAGHGSGDVAGVAARECTPSLDTFPQDVVELQEDFEAARPGQAVQAVPGAGLAVPIWLLGSSLYSAQLAAALGLPFAFASHFAPDHLEEALALYRGEFQPSVTLERPYAMAALPVFAAETDAAAARLFTSLQQHFLHLRRGRPGLLPAPVDSMDGLWSMPGAGGVCARVSRGGGGIGGDGAGGDRSVCEADGHRRVVGDRGDPRPSSAVALL